MAKHANSYRGYEVESYLCHNNNAIGEEGIRKPLQKIQFPSKIHFPRKTLSVVSAMLKIEYAMQQLLLYVQCSSPMVGKTDTIFHIQSVFQKIKWS